MKNLFMILILLGLFLTGQAQQFSISGYSKDFHRDFRNPEIAFLQDYFHTKDFLKSDIKEITKINEKFIFHFRLNQRYGYLRIGAKNIPRTLFSNVLLIKSGDSVEVHRDSEQKLYFTGKGASLLNYQIWLGKQLALEYKKHYGTDESLLYQKARINNILHLVEDTLTSYRVEWGDTLFNLMKHASSSAVMQNYIGSISPLPGAEIDSSYNQKIVTEIQFLLDQQRSFISNPPPYIEENFFYTNYLYTLIERYVYANRHNEKKRFLDFYNEIERFSGTIRDRLLVYSMLSNSSLEGTYDNYAQVIDSISDPKSKEKLRAIGRLLPGAPLKDFDFQDRKGNSVKLSEFKGKVLIIKTWYYGCPPCAAVSSMLEPVVEHYKGNKEVVFLTINADKKKETFEKGIESGLYGKETTSRFVYTNGLGFYHPMMLYYNYSSAPNLLMVGKDTKIISSNPPRRNDNKVVQEWINLIDAALK